MRCIQDKLDSWQIARSFLPGCRCTCRGSMSGITELPIFRAVVWEFQIEILHCFLCFLTVSVETLSRLQPFWMLSQATLIEAEGLLRKTLQTCFRNSLWLARCSPSLSARSQTAQCAVCNSAWKSCILAANFKTQTYNPSVKHCRCRFHTWVCNSA